MSITKLPVNSSKPKPESVRPATAAEKLVAKNIYLETRGNAGETARRMGRSHQCILNWVREGKWRALLDYDEAPALMELMTKRRKFHVCRIEVEHAVMKGLAQNAQEHGDIANTKYHLARSKDRQVSGTNVEESIKVLVELNRKLTIDPEQEEDETEAEAPEPVQNTIQIN